MPHDVDGLAPEGDRAARPHLVSAVAAVAFAWLVVVQAVASLRLPLRELESSGHAIGEDGISVQIRRYANVRQLLRGVERVGYLSDTDQPRTCRGAWFFDVQLAQHALAPTLLVEGTDAVLVVGNFAAPEHAVERARAAGLEVVRDCGDGVFLFRRR